VIRSDGQTSRRAQVKSNTEHGVVVCAKGEPAKAHALVIGRLTTGRREVGVRGLGISACLSAEATRAGRRQRRHSTDEAGESRWRKGRQGVGMPRRRTSRSTTLSKCPGWLRRRERPRVERSVWTERMVGCLQRGGPDGGKWLSLHDKVFATKTLSAGFARVLANRGAPGVDGVTVDLFGQRLAQEIHRLHIAWQAGTYRPDAVKRVWIPKPGSTEQRPLGIPTVRDRVVQAALRLVILQNAVLG